MPQVATKDSIITITPSTPCQTTTTVQTGNPTVLINGRMAATVTSLVQPWTVGVPPVCVTATGTVTSGAPKVLVGGQPLAFENALTSAGPITSGCSVDVEVNLN